MKYVYAIALVVGALGLAAASYKMGGNDIEDRIAYECDQLGLVTIKDKFYDCEPTTKVTPESEDFN